MKNLGYYNGRYDLIENMTVPMNDRACYFGDGIYEAAYTRNYIVYALDDACISVLSPEASVAFVWNDKVNEGVTREEVEKEWKDKFASADAACELGEVDDIIESAELRKRICSALMMLAYKSDKAPERKHSVLPL